MRDLRAPLTPGILGNLCCGFVRHPMDQVQNAQLPTPLVSQPKNRVQPKSLGSVPAGLPVVEILRRASRGQARRLANKQESWTNVMVMTRQNSKKKNKDGRSNWRCQELGTVQLAGPGHKEGR